MNGTATRHAGPGRRPTHRSHVIEASGLRDMQRAVTQLARNRLPRRGGGASAATGPDLHDDLALFTAMPSV